MKLVRMYGVTTVIGVAAFVWFWSEAGWRAAVALLLMLWANNAMAAIGARVERDRRAEMFRAMGDARRRIRGLARSAAPGGDSRIPGVTNTEAEVAGEERP